MQAIADKIDSEDPRCIDTLRNVLTNVKLNPDFIKMTTGGGKNSPGPLRSRIGFVEEALRNAFP
jgi:hypothetical protein